MLEVVGRVLADTVLVALVLFTGAGTLVWPRAWILLALMLLLRAHTAVTVFRVSPDLLRERAKLPLHRDQPRLDKLILLSFMMTAFVVVPATAALDVFHWHVFQPVPMPLAVIGLGLFACGWAIIALSLRANAFAVTVIRVQADRNHFVVDAGPYSMVRHPMYAANWLVTLGLSLWIGSYAAALTTIIPLLISMLRIRLEERILRDQLPGYSAYVTRVRSRLLPGVW